MSKTTHTVSARQRHAWGYYTSRAGGPPMLILDCREGGRVQIPSGAKLTLLGLRSGRARLAIECPNGTFASDESPRDESRRQNHGDRFV